MTARDFATLADSRASLAVAGQTISAKMREIQRLNDILSERDEMIETLQDRIAVLEQDLIIATGELASAREQLQAVA